MLYQGNLVTRTVKLCSRLCSFRLAHLLTSALSDIPFGPFDCSPTRNACARSCTDLMTFYKCIKTGLDNPDSGLGCYAMTPSDYSQFGGFFDKVIRDYHGDESGNKKHVTDWNAEGADYDVKKLGQEELSMRSGWDGACSALTSPVRCPRTNASDSSKRCSRRSTSSSKSTEVRSTL